MPRYAGIRHTTFACKLRRPDFAFRATLTESARHQDAVDVLEKRCRILVLKDFRLDPVEIDFHFVGDAAMRGASISDL